MDLLENARQDVRDILKEGGFEVAITFESPSSDIANITGLAISHNNNIDLDGQNANARLIHCTIAEKELIDAAYPYDNADGKAALKGHKVSFADSNGIINTYKVNETLPSRTFGTISLVLGEFKQIVYDPLSDAELEMYYDASGLVINTDNSYGTVDAGGLISNWKNLKSNTSYDLLQSVTTQKPLLANGCVELDGTNDFSSTSDLPTPIKNLDNFTFIIVAESIDSVTNTNLITFQGAANNFILHQINPFQQSSFISKDDGTASDFLLEQTAITIASNFINRLNFKTAWEIFSNGNQDVIGDLTNTKSPILTSFVLGRSIGGSTNMRECKVKSIMIWKSEVTDSVKIDKIISFLTAKWLP